MKEHLPNPDLIIMDGCSMLLLVEAVNAAKARIMLQFQSNNGNQQDTVRTNSEAFPAISHQFIRLGDISSNPF